MDTYAIVARDSAGRDLSFAEAVEVTREPAHRVTAPVPGSLSPLVTASRPGSACGISL